MSMNGKVALITGAARDIGAAIASAFVEEGAFVFVTDINDENGKSVANRLGPNAQYLHLDVRENSDRPQDPEHATLEDSRDRIRVVQICDTQLHQNSRLVLRRAGASYSVQLNPPSRNPDSHVGSIPSRWSRTRNLNASVSSGLSNASFRSSRRSCRCHPAESISKLQTYLLAQNTINQPPRSDWF